MNTIEMKGQRMLGGMVIGTVIVVGLAMSPVATSAAQVGESVTADHVVAVQLIADHGDDPAADSDGYNPDTVYQGGHDTKRLYRVVLGLQTWRANVRPERVRDVSCRQARLALEQSGTWFGRIMQNGDCTDGDPTNWATGNYLNFLEQPR